MELVLCSDLRQHCIFGYLVLKEGPPMGNYGLTTLLEIAQLKEENLVCTANEE